MILCAGLGTRLKPWTLHHPKALVPLAGVPMLKRVAEKLISSGFDELTINVHHFSDQVVDYIKEGHISASVINISDETDMLLDTGGGILKAEPYLSADDRPFLVHNVDILSDADLVSLYQDHVDSGSDVSLLVSERESDRKLVFDSKMELKGWLNKKTGETRPSDIKIEETDRLLSFSGIYVMLPSVFGEMKKNGFSGKFPIMDFFLAGLPDVRIVGFEQKDLHIIDIGKPETLKNAERLLEKQ